MWADASILTDGGTPALRLLGLLLTDPEDVEGGGRGDGDDGEEDGSKDAAGGEGGRRLLADDDNDRVLPDGCARSGSGGRAGRLGRSRVDDLEDGTGSDAPNKGRHGRVAVGERHLDVDVGRSLPPGRVELDRVRAIGDLDALEPLRGPVGEPRSVNMAYSFG